MKVLIIDHDTETADLLRARLEQAGHTAKIEVSKNQAVQELSSTPYDAIFVDPSPLSTPRPMILSLRRAAYKGYPYILLIGSGSNQRDAILAGANDFLPKPYDPKIISRISDNALRLTEIIKRVGDTSEDFLSAGGVISKSAFNQLFLSSIDWADRHGERTFVMFIGIKNYENIKQLDGAYAADHIAAKLAQHIVRLRRKSDIIAQTRKAEYALLLRTTEEMEPQSAAARFAENLGQIDDYAPNPLVDIDITVSLMDLPVGQLLVDYVFRAPKPEI